MVSSWLARGRGRRQDCAPLQTVALLTVDPPSKMLFTVCVAAVIFGMRHLSVTTRQALEDLQQKRMADHAFFRDMIKRQRRSIEHLSQQIEI